MVLASIVTCSGKKTPNSSKPNSNYNAHICKEHSSEIISSPLSIILLSLPSSFFNLNSEILYLKSLGKKFDSRQGIVEIMELMLINYYQWIFQHLKRWEKSAPQIIHPDLKRNLAAMSEHTGLSISQVTDEVLYAGLVKMQELPKL